MNRIYALAFCAGIVAVMSKRQDEAARWREVFRRQAGSGLSVAAFCRRSQIPQASFYFWRRKLREMGCFTEVRVVPEPARGPGIIAPPGPIEDRTRTARAGAAHTALSGRPGNSGRSIPSTNLHRYDEALELVLSLGRRIVVRAGFDPATLRALIDALEPETSHDGTAAVEASRAVRVDARQALRVDARRAAPPRQGSGA